MAGSADMTKKAQLKRPEVLKELLEADLEMSLIGAKLKMKTIATMDNTLEGQPGDKINVIAYNYLGSAEDLAEGEEVTIDKLQAIEKISPEIKKVAKAIKITDEAVLSAYGDPVAEARKQIELSVKDKIDSNIMGSLDVAPLKHDNKAGIIDYGNILQAAGLFCDEEEEQYVLFIHPNQRVDIMSDKLFEKANLLKDELLTEGAIGRIAGCDVIVSRRVHDDKGIESGTGENWVNYICKKEAVKILTKKGVELEVERNATTFSNTIIASAHYVTWLEFGDRAIRMINKKGYKAETPTHFDGANV